ncbi:unnamed protein product [Trichogramma brassicae]|uniref:Uncharacterized protein n=1 Tax=Trichogramma brassicae TaxID=86971 RepID=A0A6H5I5F4_9HYME|nr:unnamed protein product [Trichogramma brassicae]
MERVANILLRGGLQAASITCLRHEAQAPPRKAQATSFRVDLALRSASMPGPMYKFFQDAKRVRDCRALPNSNQLDVPWDPETDEETDQSEKDLNETILLKKFGVSIAASRIIQQENVSFCNMNCVVIQTTTIILHRQRSRAAEMITKQITATAIPITGTLMAHTITIIETIIAIISHRNNYRSRNDGGNDNRRGGGNDRSHSQSNNNQSSDQKKESSRNDHAQSSGPHENLQPKN